MKQRTGRSLPVGRSAIPHVGSHRVKSCCGQRRQLVPPRVPALGKAVAQHDQRPRALLGEVHANAVRLNRPMGDFARCHDPAPLALSSDARKLTPCAALCRAPTPFISWAQLQRRGGRGGFELFSGSGIRLPHRAGDPHPHAQRDGIRRAASSTSTVCRLARSARQPRARPAPRRRRSRLRGSSRDRPGRSRR